MIILAIIKESGVDSYAGNLLQDIKVWLQTLDKWNVSHILQKENAPANFMTVRESKSIATEYFTSNLPYELYNLNDLNDKRRDFQKNKERGRPWDQLRSLACASHVLKYRKTPQLLIGIAWPVQNKHSGGSDSKRCQAFCCSTTQNEERVLD